MIRLRTAFATSLALALLTPAAPGAGAGPVINGDGRFGIVYDESMSADRRWQLTSRARLRFGLTIETDGGMEFGIILRPDELGSNRLRDDED
ncbi:hypothetical protein C2I36_01260 [Rhodobacteraceae bacterium WD3A24]|nr:hypothetical protein C2I36_01260 [Rhodobacteraceae bacterium WD3A24]